MAQSERILEKPGAASAEHDCANTKGWLVRFLVIWTGQALSLLGSQVAGFAVLWWMTVTPLGLAIAGPLADRTGTGPWFVLAGIVSLLATTILMISPAVKHLEDKPAVPKRTDEIAAAAKGLQT